ncbi:MAG: LytR C-terminal domain-containing protein, partial [Elusimicrobia bacterium]|nr:LytR C-terminal domain-containing protein [Elusimicrobiota bacterium]
AAAVCALAAVAVLAWRESRLPAVQALRGGRPLLGWVALSGAQPGAAPSLHLAIYQPRRRSLDLVYVPGSEKTHEGQTLDQRWAAARRRAADPAEELAAAGGEILLPLLGAATAPASLPLWRGTRPESETDPALAAADWILSRSGPRLWPRLLRAPPPPGEMWRQLPLALELQALKPASIRPAWLPADESAGPFLASLLAPEPPAAAEHPTVEVLNASDEPGIASRLKNILRLKGADVMSVGNAEGAQERTLVLDRIGRFANADAVRRMLGCAAARAETRVDLRRVVDVTVILARDCSP